jgi:hypothetical protein
VFADRRVQLRHRPGGGMPAPRHPRIERQQDLDLGGRAGFTLDHRHRVDLTPGREPGLEFLGICDRGRQCSPAQRGSERLQPGHRQRQQIAALPRGEGVDLVDYHALQTREQRRTFGIAEQQRQRFGRGQEHMRRPRALAGLAVRRGITAARFDPQRQPYLLNRGHQVASDVVRQRFQRRDIQRVQALGRRGSVQPRWAERGERRQESRQRLPRPGIRDQQHVLSGIVRRQHSRLVRTDLPTPPGEPHVDFRRDAQLVHCGQPSRGST